MCPFKCPVCDESIFIVPCFNCSYCKDHANLSTGIGGYIRSTQSEILTSSDTVVANAQRNRLISNDAQMHQNDTTPFKSLEEVMFSKEIFDPAGSISSVPGTSGLSQTKNLSSMSTEEFCDTNLSETNFFLDKYKKFFNCWVCKKKIDKHKKNDEGKTRYICCVCRYGSDTMYNLQMHSRIHCAKIICKICSKYYTESDSHEAKRKCVACEETFDCKSLLYQHYVLHEEDFKTRCWDCYTIIENHFIRVGYKIYFCCICEFDTSFLRDMLNHNHTHRRIVCKICNEKFCKKDEKDNKCFNKQLLEAHYENLKYHPASCCILCKENIKDNHKIQINKGPSFSCCKCSFIFTTPSDLHYHLYFHIDLQPFKCYVCGVRFDSEAHLTGHLSNVCVPLPEKCDICRARFPNNFLLVSHRAEKH